MEQRNSAETYGLNRNIRRLFRLLTVLVLLASAAMYPFVPQAGLEEFYRKQMITQNLPVLALLIVAELAIRYRVKFQDYILVAIGTGYSFITYFTNAIEVSGIELVFFLPLLLSIVYFRYSTVLFASALSLVLYAVIIVLSAPHRELIPFSDKVLGCAYILFCTMAGIAIVGRGLRIMENEKAYLIRENGHRFRKQAIDERLNRDALTGLGSHRAFQEKFRSAADRNTPEYPLHLALIDIDHFKTVNDTFGHWTGDIVLRAVGRLLGERNGEHVFSARYGGEEFALLFKGLSTAEVTELLEGLRGDMEAAVFPELGGKPVTVSIGLGRQAPGEHRNELFAKTDEALYEAKRGGRNRIAAAD